MFMRTKHAFLELGFILLAFATSLSSGAQLVPYDNFNSNHINPSKWTGAQEYDPDLRETVRQISRKRTIASCTYRKPPIHRRPMTLAAAAVSSVWRFPTPALSRRHRLSFA